MHPMQRFRLFFVLHTGHVAVSVGFGSAEDAIFDLWYPPISSLKVIAEASLADSN